MKQVTVFSTSQCAVCQTLKQWLDRQQISYQAINLEEQPPAPSRHLSQIWQSASSNNPNKRHQNQPRDSH